MAGGELAHAESANTNSITKSALTSRNGLNPENIAEAREHGRIVT
jgi:hypothetical protein